MKPLDECIRGLALDLYNLDFLLYTILRITYLVIVTHIFLSCLLFTMIVHSDNLGFSSIDSEIGLAPQKGKPIKRQEFELVDLASFSSISDTFSC